MEKVIFDPFLTPFRGTHTGQNPQKWTKRAPSGQKLLVVARLGRSEGWKPGINQGEIHIGAISFGVPLGPSRAESDWNADKRQAAGKKCLELGGGDLLGKVRLGAPSGRALAILREGRMTCPCVTIQARLRTSVRGTEDRQDTTRGGDHLKWGFACGKKVHGFAIQSV